MYPIMLDLSKKKIVVIGGGRIARHKIKKIIQSGGRPIVIAPSILPEIKQLSEVTCIEEKYHARFLEGAHLIFACTNVAAVNQQVAEEAADFQWVNQCGDKHQSDFFNMATLADLPFWVGASSEGKSPKILKQYAQSLRSCLEKFNEEYEKKS